MATKEKNKLGGLKGIQTKNSVGGEWIFSGITQS